MQAMCLSSYLFIILGSLSVIMAIVLVRQHHRKVPISLYFIPFMTVSTYAAFNMRFIISGDAIINRPMFRILLIFFSFLVLLRVILEGKNKIFYGLSVLFVVFMLSASRLPPLEIFISKVDIRLTFALFLFLLFIFKFKGKRDFMLHGRFLNYAIFMNGLAILLNYYGFNLAAALFDVFCNLFIIYLINLYFVKYGFQSEMKKV